MPALNPTGFTLLGDATVSSPMDVNTFVGEINPAVSYFAGDIATLNLFDSGSDFPNVLAGGYIYPYPINITQTVGDPTPILNYSKLGVFLYFNYTPASTKIPVQSRSFIAGTAVVPGTKILATVSFSPTATFQVQVDTDDYNPTECVPRGWLYTQLRVGCDEAQTFTVSTIDNTWQIQFPTGDSDPFQGGSRSYLRKTVSGAQAAQGTPNAFNSVLFLKMTDIQGSDFSTSTNLIPNPFVQCTFSNNSIVQPTGEDPAG